MSEASLMLTMSRPTQCFVTHAPDPGPPTTPPPSLHELKEVKGLVVRIGLWFWQWITPQHFATRCDGQAVPWIRFEVSELCQWLTEPCLRPSRCLLCQGQLNAQSLRRQTRPAHHPSTQGRLRVETRVRLCIELHIRLYCWWVY